MIYFASRHTARYCLHDLCLSRRLIRNVKNLSRPHNHQFIMLVVFVKDFKLVLAQFSVRLTLSYDSLATRPSMHLDIVLRWQRHTSVVKKSFRINKAVKRTLTIECILLVTCTSIKSIQIVPFMFSFWQV